MTAVVTVLFLLGALTATATAASVPAPVPGTRITVLVTATPLPATMTAEALATHTPTVTATVPSTFTPTLTITPTSTAHPLATGTLIASTPITSTPITSTPITGIAVTGTPNAQSPMPARTLTTTGTPTSTNLIQPLFTPAVTTTGTAHTTPFPSPAPSGTAQTTATGTAPSTPVGTPAIAMGLAPRTTATTTVTTTTTTTAISTGTAKTTATASVTPTPSATPVVAHPPANTALTILGPPTQIPASPADIANGASPAIALIALRHLGEVSRSDGVPWAGWCEMFVDNVAAEAGVSHARFPNALTDLYAGPLFQGHAPAGSLVFFDQRSSVDGHVGIALGDGTMISALSAGIVRTTYEDWSSYIGWRPYQGIGNGIAMRLSSVQLAVQIAIPQALAPVQFHADVIATAPSVPLAPAQIP